MYHSEDRRKYISVKRLIELLQSLPPEVDQVECNDAGNLVLTTPTIDYGYIDIQNESVELFKV